MTDIATPVVLFDLDGVLSRRDTMAALVTERLTNNKRRLALAIPIALLARVCPANGTIRPALNRRLVELSLRGTTESEYRALAVTTAKRLAKIPGNVSVQAISEVQTAVVGGRVLVVTASEHQLAHFYLQAIGLGSVELIASTLVLTDRWVRLAPHNIGAAKVTRLEAAGIDISSATLYTDSASDLPLAKKVARTVLVNPSGHSKRMMAKHLSELRVTQWR